MESLYVVGWKTDGQVKDMVVNNQRSWVQREARGDHGELTSRDEIRSRNVTSQSKRSKNESDEQTRR